METTAVQNRDLLQEWEALKQAEKGLRARDAASKLGVSEAELIAATVGTTAVRLNDQWTDIFIEMKKLGKVMALTRNEACVLEHKGNFQKIDIQGQAAFQVATVIGPIEQRVFFSAWAYGFACEVENPRGTMHSLQFFDKAGDAILKVFLQEKSDKAAYDALVEQFKAEDQSTTIETEAFDKPEYAKEIDVDSFKSDWVTMKDTHDFFGMLRKYKLHREHALELIGKPWAYPISKENVQTVLEKAATDKLPIMIFAGNKGNIQIHQGKVKTIRKMNQWLNVLDPEFNMHLNEELVARAWVVNKNTEDGLVSSIELFDHQGEMIAQFFGLRKPGIPQKEAWKKLVDSLN